MSDHAGTIIVLAKEPVPGRVKTRLQPAFSASEAAVLAAAAIDDTVAAVRSARQRRRILAWEGESVVVAGRLRGCPSAAGILNRAAGRRAGGRPRRRRPTSQRC